MTASVQGFAGPGTDRFRGFDGVRAIAILAVMLWHGAIVNQFPLEAMGPLRPLVLSGWMGVDLFFALSGFLITSLLLREESRRAVVGGIRRFSLPGFYIRRALRILPVFFVVFALQTFVLSGHLSSVNGNKILASDSPFGVWPYATFWGNYFVFWKSLRAGGGFVSPGLGYVVYWSLCVEEHFYLLWPLLLTFVKAGRSRIAMALGACVLMCVARLVARIEQWQPLQAIHTLSHYRMDSILWGALGALLIERFATITNEAFARPRRLALGLVGAGIVLLIARGGLTVLPPPSALGVSVGLSALAIWTTLLLIELASAPSTWLARALEFRPLAFVGRLSYAMYLIHFQAIDVGARLFFSTPRAPTVANLLASYILYVGIAVAAAYVLHITIERPFLRLKDRLKVARP